MRQQIGAPIQTVGLSLYLTANARDTKSARAQYAARTGDLPGTALVAKSMHLSDEHDKESCYTGLFPGCTFHTTPSYLEELRRCDHSACSAKLK